MKKASDWMFWAAMAFVIYMPLHVFIVQSASLITGGLDVWKAAKDIIIVLLVPLLLYLSYRSGLFHDKTLRLIIGLGGAYTLLHGLFVLFDQNDDTYSAIVGSVYNTRLLGFLLLGYIVGTAKQGRTYLRYLVTASVLIASIVALFGVAQYFLPADLLENVGYTVERGVKPLFFIDDKPDLTRVMSTLKDPNSLGAFLIMPILFTGMAFLKTSANSALFVRPFRRSVLAVMLFTMLAALFFTFSRGALLGLMIAVATLAFLQEGERIGQLTRKFWYIPLLFIVVLSSTIYVARDSELIQDYVFHAAEREEVDDPNEKRLSFMEEGIDRVSEKPLGHGPGTAGIVSINNPQGGFLTENYYLQIAYEVGWLGLALFVAILAIILARLLKARTSDDETAVFVDIVLASLAAYLFYSLFIHLWSNEVVALQWWLLAGLVLGLAPKTKSS